MICRKAVGNFHRQRAVTKDGGGHRAQIDKAAAQGDGLLDGMSRPLSSVHDHIADAYALIGEPQALLQH